MFFFLSFFSGSGMIYSIFHDYSALITSIDSYFVLTHLDGIVMLVFFYY